MTAGKMSAILLAAGFSSRMRRVKALLPWKGRTLIEYQIEQMMQAGFDEIIVVLGYKAEKLKNVLSPYDVKLVLNPNFAQGKTTSIRKGAAFIQKPVEVILVSAVDQPVSSRTLEVMIEHLLESKAPIAIPVYREKRGHPILFSGNVKEDLLVVNEETKGLRNVIRKYNEEVIEVPVEDEAVLWNFNHPHEYADKLRGG